jgi:hypothetical protein
MEIWRVLMFLSLAELVRFCLPRERRRTASGGSRVYLKVIGTSQHQVTNKRCVTKRLNELGV